MRGGAPFVAWVPMATNIHPDDFADTLPTPQSPRPAAGRRHTDAAEADALLTPYRLVALVGWVAAVTLLLALIAGVARSQVARGQDFQFANTRATAPLTQIYSSRGGSEARDLKDADRVAALTAR